MIWCRQGEVVLSIGVAIYTTWYHQWITTRQKYFTSLAPYHFQLAHGFSMLERSDGYSLYSLHQVVVLLLYGQQCLNMSLKSPLHSEGLWNHYYLVTQERCRVAEPPAKEHYGDWWPFYQPQSIWKAWRMCVSAPPCYYFFLKLKDVPKHLKYEF